VLLQHANLTVIFDIDCTIVAVRQPRRRAASWAIDEVTMRDQYYGDRKDIWKWTVSHRLIKAHGINKIIYAAMMRPNAKRESGHGGNFDIFNGSNEEVASFFDGERRSFGLVSGSDVTRPEHRRVNRIERLGVTIKCPIIYIGASYGSAGADRYFLEQMVPWLSFRKTDEKFLVLLDPDTGISQTDRHGDEQLGTEQLKKVWGELQSQDILMIYSEPARTINALSVEADRVSTLLKSSCSTEPFPFQVNQGYLIIKRP
jgi:hypothetical protein